MERMIKGYKGIGMEGGIARWYDKTTRRDMAEFQKLAARIAAGLPAGAEALEVAPGPGFLSIELAKRGLQMRAIDISRTFVELVEKNSAADGVQVEVQQGDAAALPIPNSSVDFVVCRAAFKNFTKPVKALREMHRVLRPDGLALLIDMHRDASLDEIRRYVDGLGLNAWNRWFTMFTFKHMLIKRAYPLQEIKQMIKDAGWAGEGIDTRIELTGLGFAAWMRKQQ